MYQRMLLTSIFLISSILTFSQTGGISGNVRTETNELASDANLTLKGTTIGATTDFNGNYSISGITPGVYTLVASFVGMKTVEKPIQVIAGRVTTLDFVLPEDRKELDEVVVQDTRTLNEKTVDIGKSGIRAMDLPQSVIVIDATTLRNQQVGRLSDVLNNTSGVYVMGTTGGVQEEIAGRGFAYGSNNTFKNGVRYNNGAMPETTSLERIEILKGSSAILFGNVAAGGVLNLVTKKPQFQQGGEISFRAGSYAFYKPAIDIYGPINSSQTVAFRINTTYENALSFRDQVKADRIFFNPSFMIKASKKTEILIEGDYLRDNRTLDYGTGTVNYEIADIPRNTFLGASWSYNKVTQKSATVTVIHTINEKLNLRMLSSYQGYDNDLYGTTRPNASSQLVKPDGTWVRGLQRTGTLQDYYIGQADLIGNFKTGSIKHQALVGIEYDQYQNTTLTYGYTNPAAKNQNVYDSINIYNLNLYSQRTDIPTISLTRKTDNPVKRVGVYVQDMVTLLEKLKVLAGVRYSYIESKSNVVNYPVANPTSDTYYDGPITSRFGLVYQPMKQLSVFSSYANSFTLNTNVDASGKVLSASNIDQSELGVKSELFNGFLSANVTTYKIVNGNLAQPVLGSTTNAYELAGEVTSKGVELDVMSRPVNGFSVIAGYSYNDTRYTKSTQYVEGSLLRYNPQHTANGSVFYSFKQQALKNFRVGVTTSYIGERVAGRSTRTAISNDTYKLMPIPAYLLFDIHVAYTLDKISVRVKASNLLNELSYNVHDDNSVNPIAPRQFTATLSYRW